ncbi:MAG: hypothetical protein H6699_05555 [Myxococcales bacterium]|nr:hypothetical protein [Myxococcales bacterium]
MHARNCLLALMLTCSAAGACGGRDKPAEGGEALLTHGHDMMGQVEERARNHVFDMATILETNLDDPATAVTRMQNLFSVNGERMIGDAVLLEQRLASLEGDERRLYEAQLAAYLDEAFVAWRDANAAFVQAHPAEGREIGQLVELFDRTDAARRTADAARAAAP